jgi:hypothetical protein
LDGVERRRHRPAADREPTKRFQGINVSHIDAPHSVSDLMTIAEAADHLRTPVATLRYWRHVGAGPAGFRLGRRLVYRRTDLDCWISEQYEAQSR